MKAKPWGEFLAVAGGIVAAATVCVSIYVNPPSAVKAHALDQQRLQSLQQIDMAIKAYYHNHHALPDGLDTARSQNGLLARSQWTDPVTQRPYEYEPLGPTKYRLCADFSAESDTDQPTYAYAFRKHRKGHDCFQQDATTE